MPAFRALGRTHPALRSSKGCAMARSAAIGPFLAAPVRRFPTGRRETA